MVLTKELSVENRDWNNISDIFSKGTLGIDEVELDKLEALSLEERRQLLLDDYTSEDQDEEETEEV
jgi:hypothetical protein